MVFQDVMMVVITAPDEGSFGSWVLWACAAACARELMWTALAG